MGRCSDARHRLLATATQLFHERGYTAVSVSDICDAAGLRKGSFYHFFESKKALVLEALDEYAERNRDRLVRVFESGGATRERLQHWFSCMYESAREVHAAGTPLMGCPIGNLAAEMAGRDAEITAKLESIFGEWRDGLKRMLTDAKAAGELDLADPSATAESLVVLVEGAALMAKTMSDPEIIRRAGDRALSLLEPALLAARRESSSLPLES